MDGFSTLDLALFAAGAFAAAFVTGLAGFAFGIVAAAVWLHFLSPAQATALIVAFGLIVQGVSVWKLRGAIKWPRLVPFLIGGVIGVPIGAELLRWTDPAIMRIAVGAIMVLFSLYSLFRPSLGPMARAGVAARGGRCRQRGDWRRDRARGHRRGDLVQPARLAAAGAARRVPARRGRGVPDDRAVARRHRHDRP